MAIQAKCPGCQASLRIPSDWVHKSVRCKRCGTIIRVEGRAAGAIPVRAAGKKAATARPAPPAAAVDDFAGLAEGPSTPPTTRRPAAAPSWRKLGRAALWVVGLVGIGAIVYVVTPARDAKKEVPVANP